MLSTMEMSEEEQAPLLITRATFILNVINSGNQRRLIKDAEKDVLAALTDASKCYGNHAPELLLYLTATRVSMFFCVGQSSFIFFWDVDILCWHQEGHRSRTPGPTYLGFAKH